MRSGTSSMRVGAADRFDDCSSSLAVAIGRHVGHGRRRSRDARERCRWLRARGRHDRAGRSWLPWSSVLTIMRRLVVIVRSVRLSAWSSTGCSGAHVVCGTSCGCSSSSWPAVEASVVRWLGRCRRIVRRDRRAPRPPTVSGGLSSAGPSSRRSSLASERLAAAPPRSPRRRRLRRAAAGAPARRSASASAARWARSSSSISACRSATGIW